MSKENKSKNFLGKKHEINHDKTSDEKQISLYENYGENETVKESKTFKEFDEFDSYLSSLKNPFTVNGDIIMELNSYSSKNYFFKNKELTKIYEKEDFSELYEDYKSYQFLYINAVGKSIKTPNPMPLDKVLTGPKFFFDLPEKNCPKFYRDEEKFPNLFMFLCCGGGYNLFHLYMRKKSGSTLYLMKQMERKHEGFVYFDLRKLNDIFLAKTNLTEFNKQLKNFIFYSLFNLQSIYNDAKEGFQKIEKCYYYIISKIHLNLTVENAKNFFKILLNSYINLYKEYVHELLLIEKKPEYKMLIFILDHYNNEIEYDFIKEKLENNNDGTLLFLIKHSLNNKKEIDELFQNIDDTNYKPYDFDFFKFTKGIELIHNKTIVGFYEEMYTFNINNFESEGPELLKLYKNELIENFGLINPNYFYKFIEYMKDNDTNSKNSNIFKRFLKIISTEIELDIRQFYNNSLEDENFFMSKYYNTNFKKLDKKDKNLIEFLKKNLPLNYFIIKFKSGKKEILEITPSCNLVEKIIERKSKNFASIIYQSKYYEETGNQSEKGNIFQRVIEEKLKNESYILLNYAEKTLIFELEYLIPSAKNVSSEKADPVLNYYDAIKGQKRKNQLDQDINSYITDVEKKDMEKLSEKLTEAEYDNVILIEKTPNAKNYDLAIIKFTQKNSFVLILFQITVSKEKKKFQGVNQCYEYDISYIVAKIEKYLKGYKSEDVHLIYVLDRDEENDLNNINVQDKKRSKSLKKNEKMPSKNTSKEKTIAESIIDYKNGLNNLFENKVHLLFFGRKYLKFYTEQGKIIKELSYSNQNINFITSDINHYFLDENIQRIFNKIIAIFNIEVGIFYIDSYDYTDVVGNSLIITKIDNTHATVAININGKKLHLLEVNKNHIEEVIYEKGYPIKESYFFEIINPKDVNAITLFSAIDLDNK